MQVVVFFKVGNNSFQTLPVTIKKKRKRKKAIKSAVKTACQKLGLAKPTGIDMPFNGCGKTYFSTSHVVCGVSTTQVLLTASIGRHSG